MTHYLINSSKVLNVVELYNELPTISKQHNTHGYIVILTIITACVGLRNRIELVNDDNTKTLIQKINIKPKFSNTIE
jgi:hypothetical protein